FHACVDRNSGHGAVGGVEGAQLRPVEDRLGGAATVIVLGGVIGCHASLQATDHCRQLLTAAIAVQDQTDFFVDSQQADDIAQFATTLHFLAINFDDDVGHLDRSEQRRVGKV